MAARSRRKANPEGKMSLGQHLVELLLADFLRRRSTERIFPRLANPLAPIVDDRDEGALAGTVADEPFRAA